MKIQDPEVKKNLVQRLKRLEGQVRGLQTMLADERDCGEIMQQLTAVHSATRAASRVFLQEYASVCLSEMDAEDILESPVARRQRREQIVQDLIVLLDKTP